MTRSALPRFFLRYGREFAACGFRAKTMYRYEKGKTRFAGAMLEAQARDGQPLSARRCARRTPAWIARLKDNLAGSGLYGL